MESRKRSSTSAALDSTKAVHKDMRLYLASPTEISRETLLRWRAGTADANKEIARLSKELHALKERHRIDMAVMTEEMRRELVDREANSARLDERYRLMTDRDSASGRGMYDRAVNSAASVEASIAQICAHALNINPGTTLLMQKTASQQ